MSTAKLHFFVFFFVINWYWRILDNGRASKNVLLDYLPTVASLPLYDWRLEPSA